MAAWEKAACKGTNARLEAKLWSQANSQIIVRAVQEVDVIADFGSNPDRAGKSFEASARIDCELRAAICEAHGIRKAGGGILIGDAEIIESNFARHEHAEWTRAGLELRSKKAVQRAETRCHRFRRDTVAEGLGIASLEIISHLRFNLNAGVNVESGSATNSQEILRWRGVTEPEIIGEGSDLDVIGRLLREQSRRRKH